MHSAYLTVLLACTAAVVWLIVWRLIQLRSKPRPSRARLINEWIWTLIPLAVLIVLVWASIHRG
ncbi:MAG TPA: hypothetical protein VN690_11655 [Terriglobales bacterium]|nr:hypothetical protein [Terriglobales bacterium]